MSNIAILYSLKILPRIMNFDFDLRFLDLPEPTVIALGDIKNFISDKDPKRINFRTTHANALYRFPDSNAYIRLPFDKTFEHIAREMLGMTRVLYLRDGKYVRRINKDEYATFKAFIENVEDIVFLRDCLDLSIALSMHEYIDENGTSYRSPLGEHEYQVKYHPGSKEAEAGMNAIVAEFKKRLNELPYFKEADYIMAVPSAHPFMQDIIKKLTDFKFEDVSSEVKWMDKKGSLKDKVTADEKLSLIDSWGFELSADLSLVGKVVLLVDDMYQSGVTMQYVAMKLKEAGAKRVFGICICKALSNN